MEFPRSSELLSWANSALSSTMTLFTLIGVFLDSLPQFAIFHISVRMSLAPFHCQPGPLLLFSIGRFGRAWTMSVTVSPLGQCLYASQCQSIGQLYLFHRSSVNTLHSTCEIEWEITWWKFHVAACDSFFTEYIVCDMFVCHRLHWHRMHVVHYVFAGVAFTGMGIRKVCFWENSTFELFNWGWHYLITKITITNRKYLLGT